LKEGNSIEAIHEMYPWVNKETLAGAIDEAIQTITTALHGEKFFKHKLLLDENMPGRTYFTLLNERFDVKHVAIDYKQVSLSDEAVYELAREEGRLIVTHNTKDFTHLAAKSTSTGIIGISADY
jgi:hypothetical protein